MMAEARLRIERHRFAQHIQRFLILPRKKQSLTQNAVFRGSRGIFGNSGIEFPNRRRIIALRHVSTSQAVVTALPLRTLTVKILKLPDGPIKIFLIAKSVSQIIADAGFIRAEPLG